MQINYTYCIEDYGKYLFLILNLTSNVKKKMLKKKC